MNSSLGFLKRLSLRSVGGGGEERSLSGVLGMICAVSLLFGCAEVNVPGSRNVNIPSPEAAVERREAINEKPDSVVYLPLGRDVLTPQVSADDSLPDEYVGPFELRSETLAGALQLILAEYDVSLAFASEEGLNRRITVANLRGPLNKVIRRVCSLADLYCAFSDGLLIVKETQMFTVKIPPINQDTSFMNNVAAGLQAIVGTTPVVDQSTRTIVYEASQRTAEQARRYFQQMRSSTALVTFETYIWEVTLNSSNATGIDWSYIESFGKFTANLNLAGGTGLADAVSIGLPTTGFEEGGAFNPTGIFDFLTTFGAVKTISQPQVTVLSGSEARLRVADTQNFVSEVTQTIDNGQSSTSVNTDSVDSGFEIIIGSNWDNGTVYADIEINITDLTDLQDFNFETTEAGGDVTSTRIQLPATTERELTTQVRLRPGDSLLIAGLVEEDDDYDSSGPGFREPILPTRRTAEIVNKELVFLLRPRVIVYTSQDEDEYYQAVRGASHRAASDFEYDFKPFSGSLSAAPGGEPFGVLDPRMLNPAERGR